jgi:hypothetical protein
VPLKGVPEGVELAGLAGLLKEIDVLEVDPAGAPDVAGVAAAGAFEVAGADCDDELELLGADWFGGLLTLIVGPPFAGSVAGAIGRDPLMYTMIPRITPIAVPPPPSLESGDELI